VTSRVSRDAGDDLASMQNTSALNGVTTPPPSDDSSLFSLSDDACAVKVVGNGHVTNMASSFRLSRDEGGDDAVPSRTPHHHHQQVNEKQINSQLPKCSKTITSMHIIPTSGDDSPVDDIQHSSYDHQHQQRLQNLNLQPLSSSNTMCLKDHTPITDEFLPVDQRRQHQRQWNATSKNWNSSMTTTSTDVAQTTTDHVYRNNHGQKSRPSPPPSLTMHQTPVPTSPLFRIPAVLGNGSPELRTERKTSSMTTRQTTQDSYVISTSPRTKVHTTTTTNYEMFHRHLDPSSNINQPSTATRTPETVNTRPSWFTKDRVQFFTRSELAAAATTTNSLTRQKTSKTSWFRRGLFK